MYKYFGIIFATFLGGYIIWVTIPTDRCERVMRSSQWVGWFGGGLSDAIEPWTNKQNQLKFKLWTLEGQIRFATVTNRQFGNVCPALDHAVPKPLPPDILRGLNVK